MSSVRASTVILTDDPADSVGGTVPDTDLLAASRIIQSTGGYVWTDSIKSSGVFRRGIKLLKKCSDWLVGNLTAAPNTSNVTRTEYRRPVFLFTAVTVTLTSEPA